MKEGEAILYPRVAWMDRVVRTEDDGFHLDIGVIIKKLQPGRSGELIFEILCKDGTLKEYYDFELRNLPEVP